MKPGKLTFAAMLVATACGCSAATSSPSLVPTSRAGSTQLMSAQLATAEAPRVGKAYLVASDEDVDGMSREAIDRTAAKIALAAPKDEDRPGGCSHGRSGTSRSGSFASGR